MQAAAGTLRSHKARMTCSGAWRLPFMKTPPARNVGRRCLSQVVDPAGQRQDPQLREASRKKPLSGTLTACCEARPRVPDSARPRMPLRRLEKNRWALVCLTSSYFQLGPVEV